MGRLALSRRYRCAKLMLKTFLKGNKFYCKALAGESDYNISINSDMIVSCNCSDYDGYGTLGDLNLNSFTEIFSGKKANHFRALLSKGIIPIPTCIICQELIIVNKTEALKYKNNFQIPKKGIMVENSSNCNLNCVYCHRDLLKKHRKKRIMSLDDIKKISEIIKKNNIEYINYFKIGECFLSKNINEEIDIIRKDNPNIKIGVSTNGLLLDKKDKIEAALKMDKIMFSIDGFNNESLIKYQKNGNFDKVYSNMKNLIKLKDSQNKKTPHIIWKYVVFSWNDSRENIEKTIELAKEANVNIISFAQGYAPYNATSKNFPHADYFKKLGNLEGDTINIKIRNEY